MERGERILVTGATGLVGHNLHARLRSEGHEVAAVGSENDLRDAAVTERLFAKTRPQVVFHLAARVGGIQANISNKRAFYGDNVRIDTNVVEACARHGVAYVLAMGSACAYPKRLEGAALREEDYLDGVPEPTNDTYAYAKRGLLVHLRALAETGALRFTYCVPTNLYGPHDNFHPLHAHVVPALLRRFCEAAAQGAASVAIWGDGTARRDFLYVEDCVDAMLLLAQVRLPDAVNLATGRLTSIAELAGAVRQASGFSGEVTYDEAYPTGQAERRLDISRLTSLGWAPGHSLEEGIAATTRWLHTQQGGLAER